MLGSALDNPDQEFSRVVGADLVGDSAVLVTGAGTHDMRLFNLAGSLLQTYGRNGEGPGENRGIGRIFMQGDTVWTFDVLLKRVDQWSLRDGYSRSIRMPEMGEAPVWAVLGVFADGSLLGSSAPREQSSTGGTTDTRVDLVHWAPGALEPTSLKSVLWDRKFILVLPAGSSGYPNPLSDAASIAVTGVTFWYTDSRSATVQNYSRSGELLRTVELPFTPDRVEARDREIYANAWIGNNQGNTRQRLQAVVDNAVYPETLPAITDLVAGPDGSVWAGRYIRQGETERTWFVVSADGEVIEQVSLPADFNLYDVAADRVIGVRRGEADVEQVVAYRLTLVRAFD